MKKFLLLTGAALAFAFNVTAQDPGFSLPTRPRCYAQVDAGVNLIETTGVKQFLGIPSPGTRMSFNPGVRLGVGGGYHFNEELAGELETGLSYNTARDLTVGGTSAGRFGNADVWGVPLIAGVLWTPLRDVLIQPYLGAGVGAHAVFGSLSIPGVGFSDSGWSIAFAWQVKAGFTVKVCENLELLLAYRLLGVSDHKLKLTEFEDTLIHSLSAGALLRF